MVCPAFFAAYSDFFFGAFAPLSFLLLGIGAASDEPPSPPAAFGGRGEEKGGLPPSVGLSPLPPPLPPPPSLLSLCGLAFGGGCSTTVRFTFIGFFNTIMSNCCLPPPPPPTPPPPPPRWPLLGNCGLLPPPRWPSPGNCDLLPPPPLDGPLPSRLPPPSRGSDPSGPRRALRGPPGLLAPGLLAPGLLGGDAIGRGGGASSVPDVDELSSVCNEDSNRSTFTLSFDDDPNGSVAPECCTATPVNAKRVPRGAKALDSSLDKSIADAVTAAHQRTVFIRSNITTERTPSYST